MKLIGWLAVAGLCLFVGCATEQTGPRPAPENTLTGEQLKERYALWSDEQLQLRRAQLRRELDRGKITAGPQLAIMIEEGKRKELQDEVEEIERELLRRDPSGRLLRASEALK